MRGKGLTQSGAADLPLPGRQIMLLARSGRTLVVQSFDMADLTEEECRYFSATSEIFVDWLEELERIGAGRPDAQAIARGDAMSRLRLALMQAYVDKQPESPEAFRWHAQCEVLALLQRMHEVLFRGAYSLDTEIEQAFLGLVKTLGEAIREGAVEYREEAQRRLVGQIAACEAKADARFQALIARVLAGTQQPDECGHTTTELPGEGRT